MQGGCTRLWSYPELRSCHLWRVALLRRRLKLVIARPTQEKPFFKILTNRY